ncbi:hypothetical protein L596_010037 [Steinernema carpocapsae]|uniref:Uncharacterized protein n=2 Tax=Steinernema carpocapsae TaxID=34508 RepID=A0A4U5PIF6_STECR|nr:hypothetical protein L596_010037 [Steinernema carpocapsae]
MDCTPHKASPLIKRRDRGDQPNAGEFRVRNYVVKYRFFDMDGSLDEYRTPVGDRYGIRMRPDETGVRAQPAELSELEEQIDQLKRANYHLECEVRQLRGQLPRVKNASEEKLRDDVMALGDQLDQSEDQRSQLESDLRQANQLAEKLMAEKIAVERECDARIEKLQDDMERLRRENNENYQLYMEHKTQNGLLKSDLDRFAAGRPSMDLSVATVTSDGNMSILSERDKEMLRMSSTLHQAKMEADQQARKLQEALEEQKKKVSNRDDMIRQLLAKQNTVEKKKKEIEELLKQERTMHKTYMENMDKTTGTHQQHPEDYGREGQLQADIEDVANRHLSNDRSVSDSVAQLYVSHADLPNVSARPDDTIQMSAGDSVLLSTTDSNMSLSIAFNQIKLSGTSGENVDMLAQMADALFSKLRKTAATLRSILGHKAKIVSELEASIRELETSVHTSFIEGVGTMKRQMQARIDDTEAKLQEAEEEKQALDERLADLDAHNKNLEGLVKEQDEELQTLEHEKIALKKQIGDLEGHINDTEAKLQEAVEEKLDLAERLADLDVLNKNLEAKLKEQQEALEKSDHSIREEAAAAATRVPTGWTIVKCADRLDAVDAKTNNIVQLLKTVGTSLPIQPHAMETMMKFGREARDEAYKCAKFLRLFDKENQGNSIMSDKVRETLERELKDINKVLKQTAVNARLLNSRSSPGNNN